MGKASQMSSIPFRGESLRSIKKPMKIIVAMKSRERSQKSNNSSAE